MNFKFAEKFIDRLKKSFIGRAANILWISIRRYNNGGYAQSAVALTFYTLFAIVPVAALFFGIAKGFDLDVKLKMTLAERLSQHQDLLEYVYQFADTTLKQARGGVVAGAGVVALFVAVIGLYSNIELSLNAVWELPPRRNLLHRFSNYISCMVVIPMLMVMISSAGVFLRTLAAQNSAAGFVITRIVPLLLTSLIFFLIYLLTPNTRVRIIPALAAGVAAGIAFQLLQDVFVLMQRSIFRYNRIYGSFAALPLFMIWLRWSWEIALFGAELAFVMQHIDTGMFDSSASASGISIRSRRIRQLTVAHEIYARFYSGGGASTFGELAKALNFPPICLERELTELIAAKVICRVENSGDGASYVPLQPSELTVAGCLQMLDDSGIAAADELGTTEKEMLAAESRLREAVLKCPANTPLVEAGGGHGGPVAA